MIATLLSRLDGQTLGHGKGQINQRGIVGVNPYFDDVAAFRAARVVHGSARLQAGGVVELGVVNGVRASCERTGEREHDKDQQRRGDQDKDTYRYLFTSGFHRQLLFLREDSPGFG